jgi:predicted dinucleotide-binding enzyme
VAQQVKSIIGGPTSKAFNRTSPHSMTRPTQNRCDPARCSHRIRRFARSPSSLIRDAGFDPIHLGDLRKAPLLEGLVALTRVLGNGELGPFFYRFNRPGELAGTWPSCKRNPRPRAATAPHRLAVR